MTTAIPTSQLEKAYMGHMFEGDLPPKHMVAFQTNRDEKLAPENLGFSIADGKISGVSLGDTVQKKNTGEVSSELLAGMRSAGEKAGLT